MLPSLRGMLTQKHRVRVVFSFVLLFVFLAVLVGRLFQIQIIQHDFQLSQAKSQFVVRKGVTPKRGTIKDRNGEDLAISVSIYSLFANPRKIGDPLEVARELSAILGSEYDELVTKLTKDVGFITLKREIEPKNAELIKKLNIDGLWMDSGHKRFYPKKSLASHVIGFANLENQGAEGIERSYDNYIKGNQGWIIRVRDTFGNSVEQKEDRRFPPTRGNDIVLTLDETIQYIAEAELNKAIKTNGAKSGTVIVMDPSSGEVLALANYPDYNLNDFRRQPYDGAMRNRGVADTYEPGSIFKIVTAAGALEERVVSPDEDIFIGDGKIKVGGHTFHDSRRHDRVLSFRRVMEESSNVGVIQVASRLGEQKLYEYARLFGFGTKTRIELPGEANGVLRKTKEWSGLSLSSISIGHEVSVTPIQMVSAFSSIANGGVLMQPVIVKSVGSTHGVINGGFRPRAIRRVVSRETAKDLNDILVGVVEKGTGVGAKVRGYTAAGKTGSSEKPSPDGKGYSTDKIMASFIGYVPAEEPAISILVLFDEPEGAKSGGAVAAPVFSRVASRTLSYLNVPPSNAAVGTP